MSYTVMLSREAIRDVQKLRKAGEKVALKKLDALLDELAVHPYEGTGKPKPLGGDRAGQWSRRITDKHRLVYSVNNATVIVLVLSASGHYDDK
jgi:toxin YoeB